MGEGRGVAKVGGLEGGKGGTGDAIVGDIAGACAFANARARNMPYSMQIHLRLAIFAQVVCQINEGGFIHQGMMDF